MYNHTPGAYGDDVVMATPDQFDAATSASSGPAQADQIIVGRNTTRHAINNPHR